MKIDLNQNMTARSTKVGRFVHIGNSIWQRSTRYDPWPAPLLLRWMAIKYIEAEHN